VQFFAKNVTAEVQKLIGEQENRVQILFYNLILPAFGVLAANTQPFSKLGYMTMSLGGGNAYAKFFKEVAYPLVKELVADLDTNYPGIIDEATSGGVSAPGSLLKLGLI
jgi:hypothetical protein